MNTPASRITSSCPSTVASTSPRAHRGPGRAADEHVPPVVADGDHADVLDQRLRAVARAAGHGQLHLRRALQALVGLLEAHRQRRRVAQPEAAVVGADAALHRAERLAVGVARGHVEVRPHARQVLLAHAEQVDPLAAGDLDHRDLVLVGDVGDPAQLAGGGDPALDLRHHRERAVALDVGVHAVVDEPRVVLVDELAVPDHPQQRRQRHLRARVLAVGGQRARAPPTPTAGSAP